MKKISIVMAYFNRKEQLITTLNSIKQSKHNNFEVVIVDDNSSVDHQLYDVVRNYPFVKLITIPAAEKTWSNPCMPFNIGFRAVTGEIVIIQNPECCHIGDVLVYVDTHLKENDYYTFSCYASKSSKMNHDIKTMLATGECMYVTNLINNTYDNNINTYSWYNHRVYNPSHLHFMSAIYKKNLDKVGGFDESYKDGYCFDDNDFFVKIKYDMQLNAVIIPETDVYCIHLYHEKTYVQDFADKFAHNKAIFIENHHKLVRKLITRMQACNIYKNDFVNNNANVNIAVFDKTKEMRFICDDNNSNNNTGVRFNVDIPTVVSDADFGNHCIVTDIKNIINNCFVISFEIVGEEPSVIKIDTGLTCASIDVPVTTVFTNHIIRTKLDRDKWQIIPQSTNFNIKNFSIKLDVQENCSSKWLYPRIPKTAFTYWGSSGGSKMSYLHYLTLKSFRSLNPDWKVVLYRPKYEYKGKNTWTSPEHNVEYKGRDYTADALKLDIDVVYIDLQEIGFRNDVPEVFKSNYVTYYILSRDGGVWFDMDILFIKPMSDFILNNSCSNQEVQAIVAYSVDTEPPVCEYFSTGFLLGEPQSAFYKMILDELTKNFDPAVYMSATNNLYPRLFKNFAGIHKKFPQLHIANMNMALIYPYKWSYTKMLFESDDISKITERTIGIHWFNGAIEAKNFLNNNDYEKPVTINTITKKYLAEYI